MQLRLFEAPFWKYALGLPLEHPGFNYSVLSKFRKRLIDNQAETRLLDTSSFPQVYGLGKMVRSVYLSGFKEFLLGKHGIQNI